MKNLKPWQAVCIICSICAVLVIGGELHDRDERLSKLIELESTHKCEQNLVPYFIDRQRVEVSPCLITHLDKFFKVAKERKVDLGNLAKIKYIHHGIDFRPLLGETKVRAGNRKGSYIIINLLQVGHTKGERPIMSVLSHELWHLLTMSGHREDLHWLMQEGHKIDPKKVLALSERDIFEICQDIRVEQVKQYSAEVERLEKIIYK